MSTVLIQSLRMTAWRGAILAPALLASCALGPKYGIEGNPKQPGTYAHFKAQPDYPKTSAHWVNQELLAQTNPSNSRIVVNLPLQRGMLMMGDVVVIDYPICSGTKQRPTPAGEFKIMEKVVEKSSNRYGRIYDAEGKCVNSDADVMTDPIPEGGKFVGAPMNYWMRLTHDGVGHHIGPVLRRPASHACVRGPSKVIPLVYEKVKVGSKVLILN